MKFKCYTIRRGSVLHLLCMLILFATPAFAADIVVDGISYNLLSVPDREVEVVNSDYSGNVVIPDVINYNGRELKVVSIGINAFRDCKNLTCITIGKNVKKICNGAFSKTENLLSLAIPANVDSIQHHALDKCGIETFVLEDGDHYIALGNSEMWGQSNKFDRGLFYDCPKLKTVYWGRKYRNISTPYYRGGEPPFLENKTVEKITFSGNGMPQYRMFRMAEALKTVEFVQGYEVSQIEDEAFILCKKIETLSIPGGIQKIGKNAFQGCENLKYLELCDGIQELGLWCFGSSAVEEIVIPHSVIKIDMTFSNCQNLRKITFLSDCELGGVVSNCRNIETVVFGKETTLVDSPVTFSSNENIKDIHVQAAVPPYATAEFTDHTYLNTILYVPTGSLDAYKSANVWKNFWNIQGEDTAVQEILSDAILKVSLSNGSINIIGKKMDEGMEVYTIAGEKVAYTHGNTINGLASGVYVLKIGNKSMTIYL